MKFKSDKEMVEFCAKNVKEINTVNAHCGETIEVIYWDDDEEMQIVRRNGRDEIEAFRKCLTVAMQK